ncbi:MAG: hypothetical protein IT254_03065 [Chitinophagaceae bacterium]|nr:hypothetical protein [Bacteroidota bacterium]MBS1927822.1 hypothetical protein [Bacteroidota bacterium]MCC6257279.1 hypothetical protein [Chitinophagaceae bacterium]
MDNELQKPEERVPFYRMIMDDFMLLLFLGVTIYAIFYLLWGVMELSNLPAIPEELKDSLLK